MGFKFMQNYYFCEENFSNEGLFEVALCMAGVVYYNCLNLQ